MRTKLLLDGWKCERCNHTWLPKRKFIQPRVCPKCKTPYWFSPSREKMLAAYGNVQPMGTVRV